MRVVFVDDDPNITELIQAVANQENDCQVEIFRNGADALKYLNHEPVDVVVLDLRLPILDGLTIAEEIRRNEEIHLIQPPVEMAFLTGADISDAVKRVADRVHVREIFQKPFDYQQLFREIRGWMPTAQHVGGTH
jgi:two-component system response regulator YesN